MSFSSLNQAIAEVGDALPGREGLRKRGLMAVGVLLSHVVMGDLSLSRAEAGRIGAALGRIDIDRAERDALARLVEERGLDLSFVPAGQAGHAVRVLGDAMLAQVFDALVDLAAVTGKLSKVSVLGTHMGVPPHASARAEELGIDVRVQHRFTGIGRESIRFDERSLTFGQGLLEVTLGWPNVTSIEAVDPWPRFAVRWRERGYPGEAFFTSLWYDREAFAERVEAFFELAEERLGEHDRRKISHGWVRAPYVPWEEVAELPEERVEEQGGAYRSSGRAQPTEPIFARREAPSSFERMLLWLGSTPEAPFREQVGDVVVTDVYLYARRGAGVARLPLRTLRTRLGDVDGVYVFGKRTRVVLTQRKAPCPVAQHLDRILREQEG